MASVVNVCLCLLAVLPSTAYLLPQLLHGVGLPPMHDDVDVWNVDAQPERDHRHNTANGTVGLLEFFQDPLLRCVWKYGIILRDMCLKDVRYTTTESCLTQPLQDQSAPKTRVAYGATIK